MGTTDRTDLLTWLPEAAECHAEFTEGVDKPWTCSHPDPGVPDFFGEGDTPLEAYAQFTARLIEWQESERERIADDEAYQEAVERDGLYPARECLEMRSVSSW